MCFCSSFISSAVKRGKLLQGQQTSTESHADVDKKAKKEMP